MGIENTKRWHWVVVALAVGPMLAFMNGQWEPGSGMRSLSGAEFEREIVRKEVPGDNPNLKNVVVHPAISGVYGKPVYVVTMDRAIFEQKEKGWRYQPYALQAEVPYVSYTMGRRGTGKAAPVTAGRTVVNALSEMAAGNPAVKYKYAWWEEARWSYALWTVGAVVVVGGIWPTVLGLMLGAGLGPKAKEKEYDLDRFGKSEAGDSDEATAKPEPREMSEGDRERLQEQLDKLERNIGAAAVMTEAPKAQAELPMAGGVRQLNGGALEVAVMDKEEEDKEYKGEFYPVAKSGERKG